MNNRLLLIAVCLVQGLFAQEIPIASYHASGAYTFLDVGQVRTAVLPGADNFWDLNNGQYEVPKGSGKNSIFAGALWLGGIDPMGEVRVSSQAYRQTGNDFWPGPISDSSHRTKTTLDYGQTWSVYRSEVNFYRQNLEEEFPNDILTWPGNGDRSKGQAQFIAPFVDVNGNGIYEPLLGDYPAFDFDGDLPCDEQLLGDQVVFSVYHDQGPHTKSGSKPMGIEIREMVYAYADTGMLGHQVFVQHTAINRSENNYSDFYWGNWLDVDLGNFQDDFVGSNVPAGLGYVYNGDDFDDGSWGYGNNPPAVGIHLVKGPLADAADGVDNDRDGLVDEPGEEIKISNFQYYLSYNGGPDGNPSGPMDYYNYLRSKWLDGMHVSYGQDGRIPNNPSTKFMFPGSSDTAIGWALGGTPDNPIQMPPWSEETAGNTPADRRMACSAGPFDFKPGEVRKITSNFVWARGNNGARSSVDKLVLTADSMQALFNQCFENRPCPDQMINFRTKVEGPKLMVFFDGRPDHVEIDFGDGTSSSNPYSPHVYSSPGNYLVRLTSSGSCGTVDTSLEVSIPSKPLVKAFPLKRIEGMGSGGNSLRIDEEVLPSVFKPGNLGRPDSLVYSSGYSPIQVYALETDLVPEGNYEIRLKDFDPSNITDSLHWQLFKVGETDTFYSTLPVHRNHVQYISEYKIYVETKSYPHPEINEGDNPIHRLGLEIQQEGLPMVNFVPNQEEAYFHSLNWIQNKRTMPYDYIEVLNERLDYDDLVSPYRTVSAAIEDTSNLNWNQVNAGGGPAWERFQSLSKLESLEPVMLVLTPNQNLWTRCPVIELCEFPDKSIGGAHKFDLRQSPSVNKDGFQDGSGTIGYSWFPGYAIQTSNGQRVHIAFGENSCDPLNNGSDLRFNPTPIHSNDFSLGNNTMGGRHYIYTTFFPYQSDDETQFPFYDYLDDGVDLPLVNKRSFTSGLAFVLVPEQFKIGPLTGETKIHIDFPSKFQEDTVIGELENLGWPRYGFRVEGDDPDLSNLSVAGFPNPAVNQWYYQFSKEMTKYSLEVFDIKGSLVYSIQSTKQTGFVPLGGLPQGVYNVRIVHNEGMVRKRFVKVDPR